MANDAQDTLGLQIANPKALGFGTFALGVWPYMMIWAGWFSEGFNLVSIHDATVIATYALLVAALASFLRGESWHAVFFMFWSALFWAMQIQGGDASVEAFRAWFYLTVTVFSLLLAVGGFQSEEPPALHSGIALGSSVVALGIALSLWGLGNVFGIVAGYIGLITALLAFWVTAQELGAVSSAS